MAKYGEENFYLSFSGGKDSTILHYLLDEASPGNSIPRVYCDTGIEYDAIKDFVAMLQKDDSRFITIKPMITIKAMLERDGYPFKSKEHSNIVKVYQRSGMVKSVRKYLGKEESNRMNVCPKCLEYQFSKDFKLKVSDRCCLRMKKQPFHEYEKKSGRKIAITGMRKEEGGQRASSLSNGCTLTDRDGNLMKFHPLAVVDDAFEEWYIKERKIRICDLYHTPYSFKRTGCKGCPYALDLQDNLERMARLMPNERAQCEAIWKPVYDEYRRIGYRLSKQEQIKLF